MSSFPEEPLSAATSNEFGYFPAFPGLKIYKGKYEVVHKLGFGPRSSVWLVRKEVVQLNSYYFALKILTAHASQEPNQELLMLRFLRIDPQDDGPCLHFHFTITSVHGKHLCFGLPAIGSSVRALLLSSPSKTLPVHVVKKAIGSMIAPLASLHRDSVAHGAVTPDNMLFFVGRNSDQIESGLAEVPPCVIERKVIVDDVEYLIVRSHPLQHGYLWNESKEVLAHSSIELYNVAHARIIKNGGDPVWSKVDTIEGLRPPEVIIETSFDAKVDIWMLGCAAFELLTGEPLVPAEKTEDEGDELAWLQAMVGYTISPKLALCTTDLVRECFFDDNGWFAEEIPTDSSSRRLEKISNLAPEDRKDAARFIERCLILDPADRPTIEDLRYDPWLLPGYACSCGYHG